MKLHVNIGECEKKNSQKRGKLLFFGKDGVKKYGEKLNEMWKANYEDKRPRLEVKWLKENGSG